MIAQLDAKRTIATFTLVALIIFLATHAGWSVSRGEESRAPE